MANSKKIVQAAAGLGGAGLNVEEVFSTYLYDGTGATQTITNGIDLDGEGGLVWAKVRSQTQNHVLFDTERGATKYLKSNDTSAETTRTDTLTSFNSNGFSLGNDSSGALINTSGQDYASWTWRKAPRFFDCVTYTGTGSPRTISHNLGCEPGMIIVKRTSGSEAGGIAGWWVCYHRGLSTPESGAVFLNSTDGRNAASVWNNTAPTSTEFTVNNNYVNYSGDTYVAYLFAHNDGDGEFGPDGDADIIKCGSYTGDGTVGNQVTLGFEPQWLLIKRTSGTGNWILLDNMRGIPTESSALTDSVLKPNKSDAEALDKHVNLDATGFILNDTGTLVNGSGDDYVYIAIRRGPMAVPTDATEVFDVRAGFTGTDRPQFPSGFVTDMGLLLRTSGANPRTSARLIQGKMLKTNLTDAETAQSNYVFDYQNGWLDSGLDTSYYGYSWKRAPNYFDVVAYTGTGSARTVTHNLGVAPEMIWVKSRSNAENWQVGHKDLTGTWNRIVYLNRDSAEGASNAVWWNNTAPTSEVFSVGTQDSNNGSGLTYIAYLFASLDGVSKVGSYTGNGELAPINIDCGFSSGARFVLIKRTDSSGDWYVYDSERGIVAGGDPYLLLNSAAAEVTGTDYIDPYSSGFTISDASTGTTLSVSGANYIFYAIA